MDRTLLSRVEQWYGAHREEMLERLCALMRIPSVARYDDPDAPYGRECRAVMDAYEAMALALGFSVERYGDHVVSTARHPADMADTLGLWAHLDVVPPGSGWLNPPFEPVLRDGFLLGRGSQDNKSAAVGALYLIRCLDELDISLPFSVRAYAGCDEECGSRGVVWFASHEPCPALSLVPDCRFPVCYGEKGIIDMAFRAKSPLSEDVLALEGGVASNVIPDAARVALRSTPERLARLAALPEGVTAEAEGEALILTAHGASGHAGFPVGRTNAIRVLTKALLEGGWLSGADEAAFRFLDAVNEDCFGAALGIAMEDAESGALTCAGTVLSLDGRRPVLTANIRYCVTADGETIRRTLAQRAERDGFELARFGDSPPNLYPKDSPVVGALVGVYNAITGDAARAYTMSGGTYARRLPRAMGFGIGGLERDPHPLLPEGHGGAHLPDEALDVDAWMRAMVILTMGIVEIGNENLLRQGGQ